MGDHAHGLRVRAIGQDALRCQALRYFIGRELCARNIEEQDVADNLAGIDRDSRDFRQPLGEELGIGVIDMEALGAFLQRHEARGRQHPCLTHPSAQHLPDDASFLDELFAAHQDGTDRRTQSLRKTEHHRVKVLRQIPN